MTSRGGTALDRVAGLVRFLCFVLVIGSVVARATGRDPLVGGQPLSSLLGLPVLAGMALAFAMNVVRVLRGTLVWSRLLLGVVILLEWACYQLHEERIVRGVHALAALFEVTLLVYVFVSVRREPRVVGVLPEARISKALERLVPPVLARVVAVECVIVSSAVSAAFRPAPAEPNAFGYHVSTHLKAVLPAVPIVVGVDWLVVNALIPSSMLWLKVAHAVLTAYFVVWVFGIYGVFKSRPNRIEGGVLYVHCGITKSARIPVSLIAEARVVEESDVPAGGRLDVKGPARVEITLREPIHASGLFRDLPATTRLLSSADDPSALCAAIDLARGAPSQAPPP